MENKEVKWHIEITEHQAILMAKCVEDCCRFMAGQTELMNSMAYLGRPSKILVKLRNLQQDVTPELGPGGCYGWDGGDCPNKAQRKFIAETYYLYRSIYEAVTKERAKTEDMGWNVYLSDTLRCELSGEPIKIERIDQ